MWLPFWSFPRPYSGSVEDGDCFLPPSPSSFFISLLLILLLPAAWPLASVLRNNLLPWLSSLSCKEEMYHFTLELPPQVYTDAINSKEISRFPGQIFSGEFFMKHSSFCDPHFMKELFKLVVLARTKEEQWRNLENKGPGSCMDLTQGSFLPVLLLHLSAQWLLEHELWPWLSALWDWICHFISAIN